MESIQSIVLVGELRKLAAFYGVEALANELLNDPRFCVWSGSCVSSVEQQFPRKHHYGDGGLVRHTFEVVKLCLSNAAMFPKGKVNEAELFLAALFHDSGKMYDYEKVDGVWVGTSHKRLIHHISRSAIIWSKAVEKYPELYVKFHDAVLHAILSHHGKREYGSPVAPKSRVAWMVHLCDSISARMDDADTLDVVKDRKNE